MPGIYNEQKIYDAITGSSAENGKSGSAFDTEFSRKYYLNSITVEDLTAAITKLELPDYAGVSLRKEMITAMKDARDNRGKVNASTQQSTQALSKSVSNSAPKTAAAPVSSVVPSVKTPEALPTEKELFSKTNYTLDGKKSEFKSLNIINGGYALDIILADKTQLTLSLAKNADGSWKAVEPTTDNYKVEISSDKKTITIVSKSPATKPAVAPVAAPATKPADTTTPASPAKRSEEPKPATTPTEEPKPTTTKPTEVKSDKKKVEKSDDTIKSENIAYIKANKVPAKSADGKRDISAQLADPTKATIKKLQEDMGMMKEDQDGQIGKKTAIAIKVLLGYVPTTETPSTKEASEKFDKAIEKQMFNQIDEQINKKLTNEDFIQKLGVYTFVSSPFSRVVIAAHDGVESGDLQMRYIPVRAYESILTGVNLSNWRKSTPEEQDKIIEEANKRWNTKAQAEVDRLNKKEPAKKEELKKATIVEISNNKDIVSTATSHMDKMLANKELFLSKFTEANGRAWKKILSNPFNEVTFWTFPVIATDLQMRNNEFLTADDTILTGPNLAAWRKLGKSERTVTIDALNTEWNKKATTRLSELQKSTVAPTVVEKKTPKVAEATPKVAEATPKVAEATPKVKSSWASGSY